MAFFVHWCLLNREGSILESGSFDAGFEGRASAVRFVLDRLEVAPRYGFCAAQDYWWLAGTQESGFETRLWIDADATICAQQMDANTA
ncbi:MAG: hypothetical protein ACXIVE_14605 [Salinarimonas sp.]